MRNKTTLLATLTAVIAGFFIFSKIETTKVQPRVSGAFEALSFFGQSRTYPMDKLPEQAHYAAWMAASRLPKATSATRATGPWESLGPHNRGGRTLKIAFNPLNPNTMYAGSASGGLWRSYSGGVGKNAWQQVPTGFPVLAVSSIAFPPNDSMTMFIGTGEVYNHLAAGTGAAYRNTRGSYGIGILRSTDGGVTWEKSLDFSYDQNKGIWDIEIAPSDPNIIYAATTDGVYKTTNGGLSWSWIFDVVQATDLVVHPSDPNQVIVGCGNFSSPGYGIYRTTDGGNLWYKITSNLPTFYKGKIQLALAPSNPETVYASIGNGFSSAEGASWLCRSDDFGANWTIKTETDYSQFQGWYSHDVAVHPTNPEELTVIGIEVWKSTDGGNTINIKSTGGVGFANPPIEGPDGDPSYVHSDCHDVIYHPTQPNIIYVASDGGIHRSTNGGETFASCNGRYQTAQFYNGFANSAQNEFFCMGGLQDNGTIRLNPDIDPETGLSVTWTRVFGGDGSWSAINQQNDDISFVSWQTLNVLRNTTGGTSYSSLSIPKQNPISFIAPYVLAPSNGNVIYAGSSIVAKSIDGGDSFTTTNGGLPLDGNPLLSMAVSTQNPEVVYAATAPNGGSPSHIFVTTDGGNAWDDVTGSLPDRFPMDLEVDPTNDAVAYLAFSGFGAGHIFRTTDYGSTWEDISGDLPDVPTNAVAVDPLFPNNIYAGNDLGVFVSVDNGDTWLTYHEGFPEAVMVFDLNISPANRKLRAATHGNGAYQRDLLEEPLVGTLARAGLAKLQLKVFPNPASSAVTLRYDLPKSQAVTLDLLNSSGQIVQRIFDEKQQAGKHEASLNVQALVPGIFYCRLKGEDVMGIQRLVVQ